MAKILIVEDNQGTNKAICEYMKEAGHTLFSAFTGSDTNIFLKRLIIYRPLLYNEDGDEK